MASESNPEEATVSNKKNTTSKGYPIYNSAHPAVWARKVMAKGGDKLRTLCAHKPDEPTQRSTFSPFDLSAPLCKFTYKGQEESKETTALRVETWNDATAGFLGQDYTDIIETCRQYDWYALWSKLKVLFGSVGADDLQARLAHFCQAKFDADRTDFHLWKATRLQLLEQEAQLSKRAAQDILLHALTFNDKMKIEVKDIRKEFQLQTDKSKVVDEDVLLKRLTEHAANEYCLNGPSPTEKSSETAHYADMTKARGTRPKPSEEEIKAMKKEKCLKFIKGTCRFGSKCYRSHGNPAGDEQQNTSKK